MKFVALVKLLLSRRLTPDTSCTSTVVYTGPLVGNYWYATVSCDPVTIIYLQTESYRCSAANSMSDVA